MSSPLGQYAAMVAATISVGSIAAAILSRPLGFTDPFIDTIATVSIGAIFGSFATANGLKQPLEGAHTRLDALGAPSVHASALLVAADHKPQSDGPFTPTRPPHATDHDEREG